MKKALLFLFALGTYASLAQTPRAIVVEHFTNSRCSICASRNPALFTNMANQGVVMHISYHPSSPYSSCIFNQHNSSENDMRTLHYGIYGGTPRIVINGIVTNTNFGSPTLFTPFENQTSAFDVRVSHVLTADSVLVRVVVERTASGASSYQLTVGVAEDTINYNAPNGENLHRNVFRQFATHDDAQSAPAMVGDSIVYAYQIARRNAWNPSALFAYALIQDATDLLLQAGQSQSGSSTVGMAEVNAADFRVYPIPASDVVNFDEFVHFRVIEVTGKLVHEGFDDQYNVSSLPEGLYLLNLNIDGETKTVRLPVVH